MHLKSLEILGFKSFPEKTLIEFNKGITAIVGPNGSGKSNITDAIRWVLGEQSVRTLRGDRMEDVIFSGTQSRKAMSYAEVTITIDNADGKLPIDYAEIQVTRRLYRSGESEYLLNRTTCRLKDITTFFMDTGLGRDGYSIVGQGKVDSILSNKPEDRRRVFEEASGIVKYKTRKTETEKRLESTEQNLVRIDDILNELSLQVGPLEEQAEKAKVYLRLHDTLRETEITLYLDTIRRSTERFGVCEHESAEVLERLAAQTSGLEELREKNRGFADQTREIDDAMAENHRREISFSDEAGGLAAQDGIDRERIDQIRTRISEGGSERSSIEERILRLDEELSARTKKEDGLLRSRAVFDTRLSACEEEMSGILRSLGESELTVEDAKSRMERLQDSLYDKKERAGQTRGQVGLIESRRKTVEKEIGAAISESDQTSLRIEETDTLLREINRRYASVETEQTASAIALESSRKKAVEQLAGLESLRMDLSNRQYRIATLTELERSREGYSEAVKQIMSRGAEGVIGTVGDLFQVEERYEMAIETALGNAVQNIVTDNEAVASREIAYLKEQRLGRATFMPLTTVSGRILEKALIDRAAGMPGFEGIAVDRARFDKRFDRVADNLLGRIVLTDTLDNALAMARAFGYSFRIITLDGEVLVPGGSITGGFSRTRTSGLLGRAREIERLTRETDAMQEKIRVLEAETPIAEKAMLEKGQIHAALGKTLNDLSHERVREESRRLSLQRDAERLSARIAMLRAELEQLDSQRCAILAEAKIMESEAAEIERRIAAIREELSHSESKNREEQAKLDDLRETVSSLRISVQSIVESLVAADEMRKRIADEKETLSAGIRRSEQDAARGRQEMERLEQIIAGRSVQIAAVGREVAVLQQEAVSLSERRDRLEESKISFMAQLEAANETIGRLQLDLGRIEARKGRIEVTLDEYRNRLWEEYELTYDNSGTWAREVENPAESQKNVQELRRAMKELGDVNISAVEEYARVSERYVFMKRQRDDISEAKAKLAGVIRQITEEMQALFLEHFKIINENFGVVFADLFGGGTAEVVLEDVNDILDCGIDIRAQPPGKKLQNLMPLSGGERSLTAIALLFAILHLRPTPFCVLDEIESALDDANIYMFTDYVKKYRDELQFILVTHRKGTMESAETIYGVTMQERGISKVLSMKLGD
ncbi:MAG TPA: chromosome segregation protein SMC [Clostridia bacterium]